MSPFFFFFFNQYHLSYALAYSDGNEMDVDRSPTEPVKGSITPASIKLNSLSKKVYY